ncbi:hypothetical protein 14Stepyanka_00040 [Erwinia phage Stepyanka]|uniref:Uncharacterized protein n=1 Tax=Erwinia phage Stepyanka TaxID=2961688 RepID=A0A9E7SZM3_9CAUD|nr:hypothetical protein 14Stepyanka_00040 [Erwinia phage Stepyanka]
MHTIDIWCAAFWILAAFIAGLAVGSMVWTDCDLD